MQAVGKPNARQTAHLPQISHEFERFSSYLPDVNVMVIYGGVNVKEQKDALKAKPPHVVVGTPGRIKAVRVSPLFTPPAAAACPRASP